MPGIIGNDLPFVAFVGAGASVIPPSSLPTWNGFNNLVLETLLEVLNEYSAGRQPTAEMLATFRERRDKTMFFAPDFQAQLMEDEIGGSYFSIWQSIATDTYGPVHASLAELARRGRLAAIITTNFDQLIEQALTARGQQFRVYHDAAGFATLAAADPGPLPVIKIHGSIEDTASLVDTLRQRVVGRPPHLQTSITELLRRHPWLFVGFSGADFSYDPHYLGILDAAQEAQGFVFLVRPGTEVQPGVRQIADAYGPDKASIVTGDIVAWPAQQFGLPGFEPPAAPSQDPTPAIRKRIHDWAMELGPIAVVNIIYAMLRSAGHERDAFWLMRKTWKSYRTSEDTESKAYHRYNYNYGLSLFDAGLIRNPVALADDRSNLMEWKTHADQNAFEYLARSYREGKLLAAGGALAGLMAYRGEVGRAIALASEVTDAALKQEAWLDVCDIAIASTTIYDIVHLFGPAAEQLLRCVEKAKALGDEPRRAALLARAARLLTYSKKYAEAESALNEALAIATRLDMQRLLLTIRAARGLWLAESGASSEAALRELLEVVAAMHALDSVPLVTKYDLGDLNPAPVILKGRQPELCRILLDLAGVAAANGDNKVLNSTLDELDELTVEHFQGYLVDYYVTYAQLLRGADGDNEAQARDLMRRAREVGKASGNPWAEQVLSKLVDDESPRKQ
jgi:hypothetical protein